MNRICAHCQAEFRLAPGPQDSHGICRRHYVEWARAAGIPEPMIEEMLRRANDAAFCPDLQQMAAA